MRKRLLVYAVLVALCGSMILTTAFADDGWISAAGNIWKGVKLYVGNGPNKIYVGQVLDWTEDYPVPGTGQKIRAVKIRMNDGSIEWKSRDYIIRNTFIKRDDPAL
jgi:hypothetical protein